eukprot:Sspe_Gene.49040::Locus_26026_Transcript_2_2_Confidence_1.000_Length_436::g.49040::m.49040
MEVNGVGPGPDGRQCCVEVGAEDTVKDLKHRLEEASGRKISCVRLGEDGLARTPWKEMLCGDSGLVRECVVHFVGLTEEEADEYISEVKQDRCCFKEFPEYARSDRRVALEAISRWVYIVEYIADTLKG